MGLPPSLVHAAHFTDMEVDDVASTAKMVGAEGTNVCVMASKSCIQSWLPNPTFYKTKMTLKNFLSLSEVEPGSAYYNYATPKLKSLHNT